MKLYLVCFDIVSNKIRRQAVKCLLKYGKRVQKSVFECLLNERQFPQMKSELDKLIRREEDSIRYYLLCANCARNVAVSGLGAYTTEEKLVRGHLFLHTRSPFLHKGFFP
ncbi:MAG: CRISPR-associated endonuclease Cas2 [Candidatus Cloacimonetes bacterium]|nr:CRISPR-associated endonuclease Cas2 [Candidatus Cloacimonadota bacterium]